MSLGCSKDVAIREVNIGDRRNVVSLVSLYWREMMEDLPREVARAGESPQVLERRDERLAIDKTCSRGVPQVSIGSEGAEVVDCLIFCLELLASRTGVLRSCSSRGSVFPATAGVIGD